MFAPAQTNAEEYLSQASAHIYRIEFKLLKCELRTKLIWHLKNLLSILTSLGLLTFITSLRICVVSVDLVFLKPDQ